MATMDIRTRRSVSLKIAVTICASVVAFGVGFLVSGMYYERFVLPDLIKKYPYDGQIGLAEFVNSLDNACVSALVVFVIGIIWTVKTSKARTNSASLPKLP